MKVITINHYGVTPDMPGPSKNYEMSKFFAEKYDCKSEFWICGYSHYMGKMDSALGKFKLQCKRNMGKFSIVKIRSTPYKTNAFLRQLNITVFDIITAIKILFSKDIDCIVITVPPITIFNILAAKLRKIKLVIDVEDLWPLFLQEMGLKNKLAINYMNFSANYAYKAADGIAAVSNGMLRYVSNKVKHKYMWLSPLGVNVSEYIDTNIDRSLIENKEWKNDFKIMYLGVHGKANDLLTVLKVLKELLQKHSNLRKDRKVSFIFIGEGEQKEECIKFVNDNCLKNVYFEEAVPGYLVPSYLIHADICLTNLMKIESFKLVRPNKLFQYMALGKPIISGIWGEFREIIEEVESGIYVDFTDIDTAVNKIYDLINDDNRLNQMSENGIRYIIEEGNRNKIFHKFYENLLHIKGGDDYESMCNKKC